MKTVDVLVQSAAAYSLALLVAAIADLVISDPTLPAFALISYGVAILYFVSVRIFGCTNTG